MPIGSPICAAERQPFLVPSACRGVVALQRGQHRRPRRAPGRTARRARLGRARREPREQAGEVLPPLLDVAVRRPEPPERHGQAEGRLGVAAAPRTSAAPRAGCRAPAPAGRTRPSAPAPYSSGSDRLGQIERRQRMPTMDGAGLAALLQPLQRELADRLQHQVPGLAVERLLLAQQALLDQRLDAVQDHQVERRQRDGRRARARRLAGADRLGGLQRAAPEDGQPPEQRLLVRRPAGRSSRRWRRAGSAGGPAGRARRRSGAAAGAPAAGAAPAAAAPGRGRRPARSPAAARPAAGRSRPRPAAFSSVEREVRRGRPAPGRRTGGPPRTGPGARPTASRGDPAAPAAGPESSRSP